MTTFKSLFEFYINSSIHVAIAVCCLCGITCIHFELEADYNLLLFTFFATITGYNFVKYFGLAKFHHRSLAPWLKHIQIFSFLCFIPLGYFLLQLEQNVLVYFTFVGAITFLYAIPFLPKSIFLEGKNLRTISGLKIYVIALVWAITTVVIPVVNAGVEMGNDVIIEAIQRFIYVLIAMLPFEIRDMQYDSLKLSTIPQQIGIRLTKISGVLLAMPFFFLEFFKDELISHHIVILLVVTLILILFVVFSKIKQSKYFSSFWVEGIPIVWFGLSVLFG